MPKIAFWYNICNIMQQNTTYIKEKDIASLKEIIARIEQNKTNKYVLKFLLGEINLSIKTINKDFYKHI